MLLRISLILAIVAALAAGTVSYFAVTDKIPALTKQRDDEKSAKVTEQDAHKKTKTELTKTKGDLAKVRTELATTKSELDQANARAVAQSKRADELSDKLAKITQERDDVQTQLASYKTSNLTPEQVLNIAKKLKDTEVQIAAIIEEKAILTRQYISTKAQLAKFIGPDTDIKLRADLKGKVIVVDPKWEFVVLDIGENQGAIQDGELLVSREGKLVAKIIIRNVQKDRSIANIIPGWKLGEMIEGDEVTPAHPAT